MIFFSVQFIGIIIMNVAFKLTAVLVSSAVLQGCGSIGGVDLGRLTEKMTMLFTDDVKAIEPPDNMGLSRYENISIRSNASPDNTTVLALQSQFEESKIGDELYFNTVSYDNKDKKVDDSYAIFSLDIKKPTVETFSTTEKRFRCPGNDTFKTCDSSEAIHYTVKCKKTVARAIGSYLITNASGNKVIEKDTFKNVASDTACSDHMSLPETAGSLAYQANNSAGDELAKKFVPKVIERPNDLIEKDETLSSDNQTRMEKAYEVASEGNVIKAKETYEKLYKNSPQSDSLVYNLAYCEHLLGNYGAASKLFQKYLSLSRDPNSDAQKYLDEANQWVSKGITQVLRDNVVL